MKTLVKKDVAIFEGKKNVTISSKISDEERSIFEQIGSSEDRSISYVLRELAIRGYVQYLQDGSLRHTPGEEELFKGLLKNSKGIEVAVESKKKIPLAKNSNKKRDAA